MRANISRISNHAHDFQGHLVEFSKYPIADEQSISIDVTEKKACVHKLDFYHVRFTAYVCNKKILNDNDNENRSIVYNSENI